MSSVRPVFGSERSSRTVPLTSLSVGARAVIVDVPGERLFALGVTPGAVVVVLQKCPGIVFQCDQTELAVERAVADAVIVQVEETPA